ncbi:MAG: hypothetical protein LBV19_05625 [Streptococcaceae bacterium]|jgi:hypothetical protein|nr:hypothetical protein [Streptococcaceae bacterium]
MNSYGAEKNINYESPLGVKLMMVNPLDVSWISDEQLNEALEIEYQQMLEGDMLSAEEAFSAIRREYGTSDENVKCK